MWLEVAAGTPEPGRHQALCCSAALHLSTGSGLDNRGSPSQGGTEAWTLSCWKGAEWPSVAPGSDRPGVDGTVPPPPTTVLTDRWPQSQIPWEKAAGMSPVCDGHGHGTMSPRVLQTCVKWTLGTSCFGVSGDIIFRRPRLLALLTSGVRENSRKKSLASGETLRVPLDTLGEFFFFFFLTFKETKRYWPL